MTVLREQIDVMAIERAVDVLLHARRLEIYGCGVSGCVAIDAQQRFFRLGIPVVVHRDTHLQAMSSALLSPGDCVMMISQTGRTRDLIDSARVAAGNDWFYCCKTHCRR